MGVYDSVWVQCPQCGGRVEFQTKPGSMMSYTLVDAPREALLDIANDKATCYQCNTVCRVDLVVYATVRKE